MVCSWSGILYYGKNTICGMVWYNGYGVVDVFYGLMLVVWYIRKTPYVVWYIGGMV